ncbi:MAG: 2-oxoacid:acceptor oxidoreductase family protein, partial [Phycisphaerales bacterium]|nr:2-oxoacid:acceptor oxidoreductase family protein [Phycisphaerales bacterium]
PATDLALRHVGRPVPNAVLLAGLCAMTGKLKLASIEAAIRQKFKGEVGDKNIAAARDAFAMFTTVDIKKEGARAHAQTV